MFPFGSHFTSVTPMTNNTSKEKSNVARMDDLQETVLDGYDLPDPIVPACGIPLNVITAMIAAGAKKEQLEGENSCILRVDSVDSEAWNLYEEWASSLGEVDPMVEANYAPPLHLRRALLCPPHALVADILDEANNIINRFAPLVMADFAAGIPALLANFAPLPAPVVPSNTRHANAAVTVLQRAIRNPGPNFPVINGLHRGVYICRVNYLCRCRCADLPNVTQVLDALLCEVPELKLRSHLDSTGTTVDEEQEKEEKIRGSDVGVPEPTTFYLR